MVEGVYFPGYGPEDANPDLGDSAITETAGLGSFAMAGAPAVVQYIGGTPEFAKETTMKMYEITAAEHESFNMPNLNFRGTPLGTFPLPPNGDHLPLLLGRWYPLSGPGWPRKLCP